MTKLIYQGAEASIWQDGQTVIKERKPKNYRHPLLDKKLRVQRIRNEASMMSRFQRAGLQVPKIIGSDEKKGIIEMELIKGKTLKEELIKGKENKRNLLIELGKQIAILHNSGLVHGDLTTSNIFSTRNGIAFIDFGLASMTQRIEDFAMDLLVFKKTFKATHSRIKLGWDWILEGYSSFDKAKQVIEQITKIEKRARYL